MRVKVSGSQGTEKGGGGDYSPLARLLTVLLAGDASSLPDLDLLKGGTNP